MSAQEPVVLRDLKATRRFAESLAESLTAPMTLALTGSLGAGKTQLIRYLVESLGVPSEEVTSPTYVLLQRYTGRLAIYHLDFYRLKSAEEAWDLGLDEIYELPCLVCIEWAEKFPECLPEDYVAIALAVTEQNEREVVLTAHGPRSQAILADVNIA